MPEMKGFEFYEEIDNIFIKELKRNKIPSRAWILKALDVAIEEEYAKKSLEWKAKPAFVRKPISVIVLSNWHLNSHNNDIREESSSPSNLLLDEIQWKDTSIKILWCSDGW